MTVDDIYTIDRIKRIYFGDERNIDGFYCTELFGLALKRLEKNFCLISAIESMNALNICKINKACAYIICECNEVSKEIKDLAKIYKISLFTYGGTSVELLQEIFKLEA